MVFPEVAGSKARASEERLHRSIRDAVMPVLGTTPEKAAYVEASLDAFREYGELTPFEMAMRAWDAGDMKLYEACQADRRRLAALARAAYE